MNRHDFHPAVAAWFAKAFPAATPAHKGMSAFIFEKQGGVANGAPGVTVSRDIEKLGGIGKKMPLISLAMLVGLMAMVAQPGVTV